MNSRMHPASWTRTALVVALAVAPTSPLLAQQLTPQWIEDSARRLTFDAPQTPAQVCESGATWLRLGFSNLVLAPGDSLTLVSSQGDRYTFADARWNTRRFHARALRGDCVTLQPNFSGSSQYEIDGYDAGTLPLQDSRVTVAGAGDLCDSTPAHCDATADLIEAINPTSVFLTGDNAYNNGTLTEYNTWYAPNWGRFKILTQPVPGNHEYNTTGAAGYFDYFNGVGQATGPAGDRTKGYYSYDVGEWHFVALNSRSGGTVSSTQLAWLDADLAANTKSCVAAVFHHPFLSRGEYSGYATMKPFFDRLYAAKADLVLVGHDHNYQRYAKMDAYKVATTDGVRQVVVGTGGRPPYAITGTHPLLEVAQGTTWGVLSLDLTAAGYGGTFVPVAGQTWTDGFAGTCNRGLAPGPDFNVTTTASSTLALGGSTTKPVSVNSVGGFASSVKLALSGMPNGTRYTFSPSTLTPDANGTIATTLTLRAGTTTYTGSLSVKVKATSGTTTRTTTFRLTVK
jgi:3',5'-cyclic AMP phosphodiesterase CpdA